MYSCNNGRLFFPHPGFVTESTPLQPSWRGEADTVSRGEVEYHRYDSFSARGEPCSLKRSV